MKRSLLYAIALLVLTAAGPAGAQVEIDINRPRSVYECDLPNGIRWYGSEERCLQELCIGHNVTNRWTFDNNGRRRRKNPCYGINPRTFGD